MQVTYFKKGIRTMTEKRVVETAKKSSEEHRPVKISEIME